MFGETGMVSSEKETETVGQRGLTIYERDIAPQLSDDDQGRYVAIDVNTGEWEIDDTRDAIEALRARVPDADIFILRHIDIVTGYFGGRPKGLLESFGIKSDLNGLSQ